MPGQQNLQLAAGRQRRLHLRGHGIGSFVGQQTDVDVGRRIGRDHVDRVSAIDARDGDRVVQQCAIPGREDAIDPRGVQRLRDSAQHFAAFIAPRFPRLVKRTRHGRRQAIRRRNAADPIE